MEADDILSNQVQVCGPEPLKLVCAIAFTIISNTLAAVKSAPIITMALMSMITFFAGMLLGSGKAVCFICDAAVLAVGALLYRSAAMSRFYAGQPRWYTLAGCVLCFLASRAALEPLLSGVEAFVRWCLAWPFVMLWRAVLRPFAGAVSARFQRVRTAHSAGRVKKSRAARKKRLQNSGRVLYNSK